jgi:hypothetical protein
MSEAGELLCILCWLWNELLAERGEISSSDMVAVLADMSMWRVLMLLLPLLWLRPETSLYCLCSWPSMLKA